jgi:hypothetical protein
LFQADLESQKRASAIEVSLQVAEDLELERQQLHGQWKRRLERAGYETALARTLCR